MFREIKNRALRIIAIVIFFLILFICAVQINFLWLFGYSPSYADIKKPAQRIGSELYTSDGKLIGRYFRENRTPVDYNEIAPVLVNALVATEDIRFYKHSGIDVVALGRAFAGMGKDGGASTITQQLAKNMYRTRYSKSSGLLKHIPGVRTAVSKFKEWMTAVKLESNYPKNEILTMYLNTVSFGNNAYGIKTAARVYFDKKTIELDPNESALLVGMLKGTNLYNPIKYPENALNRRNTVLNQLARYNYLSSDSVKYLSSQPIKLKEGKIADNSNEDSYLRTAVDKYLEKWSEENDYNLYEDGLKIYTTIDSKLQKYAEEAVQDQMKIIQKRFYNVWGNEDPWEDSDGNKVNYPERAMKNLPIYQILNKKFPNQPDSIEAYFNKKKRMTVFSYQGDKDTLFSTLDSIKYYGKIMNTGMMTLEPKTGKIKVWVGGINHKYFKYDHVNQAKRQAGSTFKPFAYLAALESGMSPCDTFIDKPVRIPYQNKGKTEYWEPKNADWHNTYGEMTLRHAMGRSVNTITAQVSDQVGPENVVKWAKEVGIESPLSPVASVALGPSDVSVYEMVKAYGTFLNEGMKTDPILVERITDQDDNIIEEFVAKSKRAISEEIAWLMLYMFRGGMEEPGGTSRALWEWDLWKKNNQIGGKTGTSSDYVDAWYIGLTKDLVTGVWVGCDERTAHFKNGETGEGSRTALPIFGKFMEKVYKDPNSGYTYGPFPKPKVEITRKYNCPTIIISKDTVSSDSNFVDSVEVEPVPLETEPIPVRNITDNNKKVDEKKSTENPNKNLAPPTTTPLTRKEERELNRQLKKQKKNNQNN
ncbi:MAG: penicillin-binding protein [Pedobacter sp.]|nr:MAG: penicillin-binding protein [Pedobacter sp.]